MADGLSITQLAGDVKSRALENLNKFKFNRQQQDAVASNWTPQMQNQLMNALNGTTDAACGRTN